MNDLVVISIAIGGAILLWTLGLGCGIYYWRSKNERTERKVEDLKSAEGQGGKAEKNDSKALNPGFCNATKLDSSSCQADSTTSCEADSAGGKGGCGWDNGDLRVGRTIKSSPSTSPPTVDKSTVLRSSCWPSKTRRSRSDTISGKSYGNGKISNRPFQTNIKNALGSSGTKGSKKASEKYSSKIGIGKDIDDESNGSVQSLERQNGKDAWRECSKADGDAAVKIVRLTTVPNSVLLKRDDKNRNPWNGVDGALNATGTAITTGSDGSNALGTLNTTTGSNTLSTTTSEVSNSVGLIQRKKTMESSTEYDISHFNFSKHVQTDSIDCMDGLEVARAMITARGVETEASSKEKSKETLPTIDFNKLRKISLKGNSIELVEARETLETLRSKLRAKDRHVQRLTNQLKESRQKLWNEVSLAKQSDLKLRRLFDGDDEMSEFLQGVDEKLAITSNDLNRARMEAMRWSAIVKEQRLFFKHNESLNQLTDSITTMLLKKKHPAGEIFFPTPTVDDDEDDEFMLDEMAELDPKPQQKGKKSKNLDDPEIDELDGELAGSVALGNGGPVAAIGITGGSSSGLSTGLGSVLAGGAPGANGLGNRNDLNGSDLSILGPDDLATDDLKVNDVNEDACGIEPVKFESEDFSPQISRRIAENKQRARPKGGGGTRKAEDKPPILGKYGNRLDSSLDKFESLAEKFEDLDVLDEDLAADINGGFFKNLSEQGSQQGSKLQQGLQDPRLDSRLQDRSDSQPWSARSA